MLFFRLFQLFFLRWPFFLLVRVSGHNHNWRDIQFKFNTDIKFDEFEDIYAEVYDSCYVRQLNASHDFTITCIWDTCYIQIYTGKPRFQPLFLPSSNLPALCESMEEDKPIPDNMVGQLNSVLQALRMDQDHVSDCDDDFRTIKRFQAYKIHIIDLGQLGGSNNCEQNKPWSRKKCLYQLKFLSIEYSEVYSLMENSFCQYTQLEILKMLSCQLASIDEDALVHLLKLTALLLPNNQLTHLPKNLFKNNRHLLYVDVSDNRIQFIDFNVALQLSSLQILSLCDNGLDSGGQLQLQFPSNLEQLSFSNNKLGNKGFKVQNLSKLIQLEMEDIGLTEVEEKTFENLKFLTTLRLDRNKITRLPKNIFKVNLKLELLTLSWNRLGRFPPIAHLFNLKELIVRGNRIGSINQTDLVNCSGLMWMDLSQNQLNFIADGAFDNLGELRGLNLSRNRLSEKVANFHKVNCKFYLHLDYNNFTVFSFQHYPPSVEQLTFRFNQIEVINPFDDFMGQWNLTSLDLSNNRLVSIKHLRLPSSVYSVNLSSNIINQLQPLEKLSQRRYIDLRNNNITVLCADLFQEHGSDDFNCYYFSMNPFQCSCENLWVKNARAINFIKILDVDDLSCLPMIKAHHVHKDFVPLKMVEDHQFLCETNHTDRNRCRCKDSSDLLQCEVQSCPYNCTCLSDKKFDLVYFQCDNKGFQQIPSQFIYENVLGNSEITLDFSMNSIAQLGPFSFGNLSELTVTLKLSNSNIESIEPNAFDGLIHLRSLNLGNNQLETLPTELFHNQRQLSFLDLANNRLKYLADDAFISIKDLNYLYVHNNNLNQLKLKQIMDLKFLRNVTLHKNLWSCECTFIGSFRAFLTHASYAIQHKLDLNCVENGEEFNIANFNMDHCSNQIHLTIIIASLTIGLVLIILAGLVFRYRYELQVLIYARYGLRMLHRVEEQVEEKQYDAFVAYNSDDELFLVNELLPKLEGIEKPYRLCIHHRDFPVGAVIQDSILEAIEISSRTIILLSESFVNSGWCRFEFKSAHMKMLHDKCPRILVILIGEIPDGLEPEMKLYLKTNTYLKWGEKLFWEKLYYALPDIRVTTPPTDIMPMRELI